MINYQFWHSQVLFIVGAHGLEEHLIGLIPCPKPLLTSPIDISTELGIISSIETLVLDRSSRSQN